MPARKAAAQKTRHVNFTLDPDSLRLLSALAKKWACSQSAAIRRLLREYAPTETIALPPAALEKIHDAIAAKRAPGVRLKVAAKRARSQ